LVGNLGLNWSPTAKIQTRLSVTRDLNAVSDYNRIYTVSTDTRCKLSYQPTFKTEVSVEANATRTRFQGDPRNFFTLLFGRASYREDRYDGVKIALGWTPRERLTLQLSQVLEARNSNVAAFQYRDWLTQLNIEYLIGPWH